MTNDGFGARYDIIVVIDQLDHPALLESCRGASSDMNVSPGIITCSSMLHNVKNVCDESCASSAVPWRRSICHLL
jgi:hypothetical protein